jgi:gluconolactonase
MTRGTDMKSKSGLVVLAGLLYAVAVSGQDAAVPLPPPATETIAPDIPGVVKGGTRVQVVVDGLKHTDGPMGMPDGTLLYWDYLERRIGKIDPQGKPSTSLGV